LLVRFSPVRFTNWWAYTTWPAKVKQTNKIAVDLQCTDNTSLTTPASTYFIFLSLHIVYFRSVFDFYSTAYEICFALEDYPTIG
jgi:hypothetical protein